MKDMKEKKGFGKNSLLSWVASKNGKKSTEEKEVSWKDKATMKKAKKKHDKNEEDKKDKE